jgi:chitodextrinase
MTEGRVFDGPWTAATLYEPGMLVYAGGNVYLCVTSHTASANFNSDLIKWELFAVGRNFRNEWAPATRYKVGDVIRYNGYTYQCTLEHTSGAISDGVIVGNNDNDDDSTAETWSIVVENYTYVGEYQTSTRYRKNDLVKYGGSILKCIIEHTPEISLLGTSFENDNFETYLPGFEFDNNWNSTTYYAIGDVVRYGGVVYVSATNNTNSQPGNSEIFEQNNPSENDKYIPIT